MNPPPRKGRDFIVRHGETVYNAAARFQEGQPLVPLTRTGCEQASDMGRALRDALGAKPALTMWCSPSERAAQTLAIICGWLELDFFAARLDPRLVEISTGSWGGRYYRDVVAATGGPITLDDGVLKTPADGENYGQVAARTAQWLDATADDPGDRLVVSHGHAIRVLRGQLTGLAPHPLTGTPFAPASPQGSVALVADGRETALHTGTGAAPAT